MLDLLGLLRLFIICLAFRTGLKKMRKKSIDIDEIFHSPGGKEKYWDEVSLKECIDHYQIMVRPVEKDDVIEIDTYNELKQVNPSIMFKKKPIINEL